MTAAGPASAGPAAPEAVRLEGIAKRFGGVVALDGADFSLRYGEIHALLGENGAGKTSLVNVLAGVYRPDTGSVFVDGAEVAIHDPLDAKRLGIGMVPQEQRLVDRFTAPENVSLGHRFPRWLTLQRAFRRLAGLLSARYRLAIDPTRPVETMPLGQRQRVELVKLLHHGARILILDEPTANLAPTEIDAFFQSVRALVADGRHAVIFITHKLSEVLEYADRVTVMRSGRVVGCVDRAETNVTDLTRMMVGTSDDVVPMPGTPGEVVLEVRGLSAGEGDEREALRDVSFTARAGEVLAVAGVAGNGQRTLAEALTGHVQGYEGEISLGGRSLRGLGPRRVADLGVAYIPEDRRETGLVGAQSVALNLALRRFDRPPFRRGPWLDRAAIRRAAVELIERYDIRPPDPDLPAAKLSGGNQQRVILARELAGTPRLIVADNPTRGLDPLATHRAMEELLAQRDRGAAVIWITSDLNEALLCDRVAVMYRGGLTMLEHDQMNRELIGRLMGGAPASRQPSAVSSQQAADGALADG